MRKHRHTYFSLDLPDAQTAVAVAKKIASKTGGRVIVADEEGTVILSAEAETAVEKQSSPNG